MKRLLFIPILLFFTLSFAKASEYVIDTSHSHVSFSIKHLMISTVKGEFKNYEADIDFDASSKKFNKIEAIITASSIDTGNQKRDDHLRSPDFFEVDKFPDIKFVATTISADKIVGNLTIRDVTKEVILKPTIHGVIKFKGSNRVGFNLEGMINRKDFGLTWNKALETGGVVVGEEVKISIDIEAIEL
jgi:polyisoprenoid-binding protein YceI